jgi:hypothetical protein
LDFINRYKSTVYEICRRDKRAVVKNNAVKKFFGNNLFTSLAAPGGINNFYPRFTAAVENSFCISRYALIRFQQSAVQIGYNHFN